MKALCISDLHGDLDTLLRLRKTITDNSFEYIFLLGDYSQGFKDPKQNIADINGIIEILKDFSIYAIPGNCDQKKSVELLEKHNINMHNKLVNLPGVTLIGFGGSNPTPFNTPFEYTEEEIYSMLSALFDLLEPGEKVILMVHFPPKDTECDMIKPDVHVGSASLTRLIQERQPDLVLCSHIHESAGRKDTIGRTRIYNLGRLSDGFAYELDITGGIELKPYI